MQRFLNKRYDRYLLSTLETETPRLILPESLRQREHFRSLSFQFTQLVLLACLLLFLSFFRSWPYELFGPWAATVAMLSACFSLLFFVFFRAGLRQAYPYSEKRSKRKLSFRLSLLAGTSKLAYLSAFSLALVPVCQLVQEVGVDIMQVTLLAL